MVLSTHPKNYGLRVVRYEDHSLMVSEESLRIKKFGLSQFQRLLGIKLKRQRL